MYKPETLCQCLWYWFGSFQVKEVAPEARRRDATLSFAFVYPSKTGRLVVREVSSTFYYMYMFYNVTCIHGT